MGDLGYFDEQGRIWFCGRKAHRIQTAEELLFSVPIEGIFNAQASVFRSALAGIVREGRVEPVLWIQPEKGLTRSEKKALILKLQELAAGRVETRSIRHILLHHSFPVDIRHNAKINRALLAQKAAKKLGGRPAVAGS